MKKILYSIIALGMMASFCACGGDDDGSINLDAFSAYCFELTLSDTGRDQSDLVVTTIEYKDYMGNDVSDTMVPDADGQYTLKSHDFSSAPASGTITITQKLRSGITYDKDAYNLGLGASLKVYSYSVGGNQIGYRMTETSTTMTIAQNKLSSYFPKTTKFTYQVKKDGTVTVQ